MTASRMDLTALTFLLPCLCASCRAGSARNPGSLRERPVLSLPPRRVVSLYPTASEILAAIGAADAVAGVTIHDGSQRGLETKPMVGGFAKPDADRVLALNPDLVVLSPFHKDIMPRMKEAGVAALVLDTVRFADGEANVRLLGEIMDKQAEAGAVAARENALLALAREKVTRIAQTDPSHRPPRVMRFMGAVDGRLLVPGDDSFQNEMIRLAGGEPPVFGQNGPVIAIGKDQLREADPEAVYFCGHAPETARKVLNQPEWAGTAAQRMDRVFALPCDNICRSGANYGFTVLWLASELHGAAFSRPENQITKDEILSRVPLDLPFSYVATADVSEARLFDIPAKTFAARFNTPLPVLSSLYGWADGVTAVGNHYASPPSWAVTHNLGLETSGTRVLSLLGLKPQASSFLYTGADMAHLVYAEQKEAGLKAGVLITASVRHNAMRASADTGLYVEPGTINIIAMTNRELTPAAMTRAMITITEAKTAALQDLDVRSSYGDNAATGTGTDNIVVIGGSGGKKADMTGGHTKLGELLARATHAAVTEAVRKQNALHPGRSVFQRLAERNILPGTLITRSERLSNTGEKCALASAMEQVLLEPRYAGFMDSALALADAEKRGLLADKGFFSAQCLAAASELSGTPVAAVEPVMADEAVPPLVLEALNAIVTGLRARGK